uniref:RRM domain-containing protein n=1 Tax=Heterorhabditis bacteriophora TaxID=37862 RepID=A0A1I7XBQ5_HETBA
MEGKGMCKVIMNMKNEKICDMTRFAKEYGKGALVGRIIRIDSTVTAPYI